MTQNEIIINGLKTGSFDSMSMDVLLQTPLPAPNTSPKSHFWGECVPENASFQCEFLVNGRKTNKWTQNSFDSMSMDVLLQTPLPAPNGGGVASFRNGVDTQFVVPPLNYFTEMCSGSEAGSYLRLIDFVYSSTLGLRVVKKEEENPPSAVERTWHI